jgi:eukaryotic-like serine/threonine-protein kinase
MRPSIAIKVLNPDLTDAAVLKRFRAEAVTLARLNHAGIATIYELHHHGDELLMVMEFVRGETLHDLSDRLGPLNPPQAAHLCMQVLDALGHAHRGGVVHRDLKPANVMITDSGSIKVMDFGIARVLGSEHFTHGGYMMGTPAYMAPEQVLGREIDGRADLYSVGVLFYRLLSGRLPFNADTAISMVQMQISEAPTPIAAVRPDLPAWCTTLVERALAKAPSDRFQSAEEFRSALSSAVMPQGLGELPTLATPTPPGLRIDSEVTLPHRTPTSAAAAVGVVTAPTRPLAAIGVATVTPAPPVTASRPAVSERTTTTVVLGRTHLAAISALLVIVAVGIAVLAFAALRSPSTPPTTAAAPTPPVTSPSPTDAALPAPPGASSATPSSMTATPPPPSKTASASAPVATAGAEPAANKAEPAANKAEPAANKAGRGTAPATPAVADSSASGRGRVTTAKDVAPVPAPPPTPPAAPAAAPLVSFNQVRVLVLDAGKAREREGVLQLAGGQIMLVPTGAGAPILSVSTSALNGLFYSRSKQPRWRDASGQEVASRIDLGPMGFLRGERNWIILLTANDPIILRVEDAALRTVLPALQERTGLTVQR